MKMIVKMLTHVHKVVVHLVVLAHLLWRSCGRSSEEVRVDSERIGVVLYRPDVSEVLTERVQSVLASRGFDRTLS